MKRVLRRLAAGIALLFGAGAAAAPREGRVVLRHWDDVLDGRAIRVYLPPGYDNDASARYPVLYLLDGQNLFDEKTSFAGEWHADETCDAGIAAGRIAPLILVGIDNAGEKRIDEYTPWKDAARGGGGGKRHLARIVRELKPVIDAEYRTLPGPEDTGIGGSSLGGLMTLYAALEMPRTFARFAALSPSLWWADERTAREFEARRPVDVRVYADMGTRESRVLQDADGNGADDAIDALRRLRDVLERRLRDPGGLLVVEDEGAIHNEAAWTRRLPGALEFLFPGPNAGG